MGDGESRALGLSRCLLDVYERLYAAYGPQRWWPGETPFEVMVGAILTQSAAWTNADKALVNLRRAEALSPEGLRRLSDDELAQLIYPAGYYRAKARKLKALVGLLYDRFEGSVERTLAVPAAELRQMLLDTHGVGPETADSIVLYAAGRPAFVIDAYTRRLFARLGVAPERATYGAWRTLFEANLKQDALLFNEYHALIVRHGKERCRPEPLCEGCPLLDICREGSSRLPGVTPQRTGPSPQ